MHLSKHREQRQQQQHREKKKQCHVHFYRKRAFADAHTHASNTHICTIYTTYTAHRAREEKSEEENTIKKKWNRISRQASTEKRISQKYTKSHKCCRCLALTALPAIATAACLCRTHAIRIIGIQYTTSVYMICMLLCLTCGTIQNRNHAVRIWPGSVFFLDSFPCFTLHALHGFGWTPALMLLPDRASACFVVLHCACVRACQCALYACQCVRICVCICCMSGACMLCCAYTLLLPLCMVYGNSMQCALVVGDLPVL